MQTPTATATHGFVHIENGLGHIDCSPEQALELAAALLTAANEANGLTSTGVFA